MNRPAWWGGRRHVTATIAAFVVLASLDNAALATIPAMIKPLEAGVGASPSSLGVLVGAQVLVAAASAVISWA